MAKAMKKEGPPPEEWWTMRDGTRIAVGAMTETHAKNTLRMILRQSRLRRERQEYEDNLLDEEIWRSGKDW